MGKGRPRKHSPWCTFPSCDNKTLAHGLCSGHYKQYMAGKNLSKLREKIDDVQSKPECCIDKCTEKSVKKNLCLAHYDMIRYRKKKERGVRQNNIPNDRESGQNDNG